MTLNQNWEQWHWSSFLEGGSLQCTSVPRWVHLPHPFSLVYLLLACTLKACKPCGCPASRPKNEPGDSNRDISGLLDRGLYTKGPGVTLHCVQAGHGSSLSYSGRRRLPFTGGIDVRWAHQLPGTD